MGKIDFDETLFFDTGEIKMALLQRAYHLAISVSRKHLLHLFGDYVFIGLITNIIF
jgi:hypothetical protein